MLFDVQPTVSSSTVISTPSAGAAIATMLALLTLHYQENWSVESWRHVEKWLDGLVPWSMKVKTHLYALTGMKLFVTKATLCIKVVFCVDFAGPLMFLMGSTATQGECRRAWDAMVKKAHASEQKELYRNVKFLTKLFTIPVWQCIVSTLRIWCLDEARERKHMTQHT